MASVRKENASCKCVIVGGGPLENELRAMSLELGLESSVVFVGHSEDVRPYLEIGNVFVLPSQWEGMPLAVLEAMAYGLPCIVTDVGGNREIIVHGEHGYVVTPGSSAELAKAITHLLSHKEERERMGRNARRRVETCFDIEDTVADIKAALLN
jgi:glycosyltransferase involved in cell wall biosynthesis